MKTESTVSKICPDDLLLGHLKVSFHKRTSWKLDPLPVCHINIQEIRINFIVEK